MGGAEVQFAPDCNFPEELVYTVGFAYLIAMALLKYHNSVGPALAQQ